MTPPNAYPGDPNQPNPWGQQPPPNPWGQPAGYPAAPGQPPYPPQQYPGAQPGYTPPGYTPPGTPPKKGGAAKIILAVVALIVVAGLAILGVRKFTSNSEETETSTVASPTASAPAAAPPPVYPAPASPAYPTPAAPAYPAPASPAYPAPASPGYSAPAAAPAGPVGDSTYLSLIAANPPTITDRDDLLSKGHAVCRYYQSAASNTRPDTPDKLRTHLLEWFAMRSVSAADADKIIAAGINGLCPEYKGMSGY